MGAFKERQHSIPKGYSMVGEISDGYDDDLDSFLEEGSIRKDSEKIL